jgi:hypothetical protein
MTPLWCRGVGVCSGGFRGGALTGHVRERVWLEERALPLPPGSLYPQSIAHAGRTQAGPTRPGRASPLHPAMRSLPLRFASAPGGWRATRWPAATIKIRRAPRGRSPGWLERSNAAKRGGHHAIPPF